MTGEVRRWFVGVGSAPFNIHVSDDGRLALISSWSGEATEIDVASGRQHGPVARVGTLTRAIYHPELKQWIVTTVIGSLANVYTSPDLKFVRSINVGQSAHDVALDPTRHFIATAHWDGSAKLFDFASGRLVSSAKQSFWQNAVAFLADGRFVTVDHMGHLQLWKNIASRLRDNAQADARPGRRRLALSSDGNVLISDDRNGHVRRTNLATQVALPDLLIPACDSVAPQDCEVDQVVMSPAGTYVAYSARNQIGVLDAATGKILWQEQQPDPQTVLRFRSETQLISANRRELALRDATTGVKVSRKALTLTRSEQPLHITLDPTGARAVIAMTNILTIWELGANEITYVNGWRHDRLIQRVAWSKDGKTIATAGADGGIIIGDAATLTPRHRILTEGWSYGLDISADNKRMVVSTAGGDIIVWDVASGIEIDRTLIESGSTSVFGATFDRSSHVVYFTNTNGKTYAWDVEVIDDPVFDSVCRLLPAGRRQMTQAELQEFSFLDSSAELPCERKPLLGWRFWR